MKKVGQWQCSLLVPLLVLMGAPLATAQDAEQADAPEVDQTQQPLELEEMRVVGSRAVGRSAADSPVPVDIIDGDSLRNYGVRDLNNLLAATVPSYNVTQHAIGDANSLVRPAKMRGLPPDSTLVLVNGKRRHRSSAISIFTFGQAQGAHGVDIRSIPSIALKRVEVLRDGAGAQYGSDAVAGVLNFVLRDAPEGGTLEASWGQYYQGDGDSVNTAANIGLPLTDAGFANLSFEFTNSDSTDRSYALDSENSLRGAGLPVKNPAMIWGAPDVPYDYKFFGNFGFDLSDDHHAYAFGSWAEREILDSWYFRAPTSYYGSPASVGGVYDAGGNVLVADLSPDGRSSNCPTIPQSEFAQNGVAALAPLQGNPNCYALAQNLPGGFTPRMRGGVEDWSIAFGLRGELQSAYALLDGWNYDMSAVFGQHRTTYFIWNTVNPQLLRLKDAMPTEYFGRAYEERDKIFNLDLSRQFDTGVFYSPLNVAFGLEYREEEYEIEAGEKNGWCIDDQGECDGQRKEHGLAAQGFDIGGQAYPGIRPENAVEANRGSFGAYLDLEADVIKHLLLTAAGRFEHHEGIGESLDGKLAARWNLLEDYLALRGSIGTGFRAPTVGQAIYRDTTFGLDANGVLTEQPTLPASDPIAQQKGAKPLTPETSFSFSIGTVLTLGDLSVTLDYYNIEVRNRIGLSAPQLITAEDILALAARGVDNRGVTTVNFFANAFETYTQGIDLVATYPLRLFGGRYGKTMLTFAGNWNDTKLNLDSIDSQVIGSVRKVQVEEIEPEFRFSLMADHTWGAWRGLLRLHYYDQFTEPYQDYKINPSLRPKARALLDLEASYTFDFGLIMAAGVDNLLDTRPTKVGRVHRNEYDAGQKYPVASPYGYNGGFYYFRAGFEWY